MARLTRRDLLARSAALGTVGLAGCTGLGRQGSEYTETDPRETDRPVTGEGLPALRPFEEAVLGYMNEHAIPGATLGVAKDGTVLLERGYGFRDADRSRPMEPATLFRTASLSKALTRAAIRTLVREGELSLQEPAFSRLALDPLPGESYNDRLDEITIRQLLDHRGGWDREQSRDPLFSQLDIALERGWTEPPTRRQLVRYMLSEPLQFAPGTEVAYSNFGYSVLGQVIEAVTDIPYQQYLDRALFEPHGIDDIGLGRSLPADRPDRETWYFDEMACRNTVDVAPLELVRCPDGGFHLEATDAAGGHVATVGGMLGFMGEYWLDGRPRDGSQQARVFTGTLPGTFTIAMQDRRGVDVVLAFNQRGYEPNYLDVREKLQDAIVAVEAWG